MCACDDSVSRAEKFRRSIDGLKRGALIGCHPRNFCAQNDVFVGVRVGFVLRLTLDKQIGMCPHTPKKSYALGQLAKGRSYNPWAIMGERLWVLKFFAIGVALDFAVEFYKFFSQIAEGVLSQEMFVLMIRAGTPAIITFCSLKALVTNAL